MAGDDMLSFLPLHQSALERSQLLKGWLKSWIQKTHKFLEVKEWFTAGHGLTSGSPNHDGVWIPNHDESCSIWSPPPAAAFEAVEELNRARHMNPNVPHLYVCPRLMTCMWRKSLNKVVDTMFYVSPGSKPFSHAKCMSPYHCVYFTLF